MSTLNNGYKMQSKYRNTSFTCKPIMRWMVLFGWFYFASALTVYNNARFVPTNPQLILNNLTNIDSQINCVCICFNNLMCLSVTYSGINQQCLLYSAALDQGTLRVMTTNSLTSVLSFENKTSSK
jgi:hypothetical protein